jgi:hypothetical protein
VYNHYSGDDFAFIAISLDDNKSTGAAFVNSNSYPADEWGYKSGTLELLNDYNGNSTGIPQTVIIDLDGNVRVGKLGAFGTAANVIEIIDQLI